MFNIAASTFLFACVIGVHVVTSSATWLDMMVLLASALAFAVAMYWHDVEEDLVIDDFVAYGDEEWSRVDW